jgi:hypothetical protein
VQHDDGGHFAAGEIDVGLEQVEVQVDGLRIVAVDERSRIDDRPRGLDVVRAIRIDAVIPA